MASDLIFEDNQELSIYYWLVNLFSGKNITILPSYPDSDVVVPTIAVDPQDVHITSFEQGNRHGLRSRFFAIEIFASNKSQRNRLTFQIINNLENHITVYNYNSGFPPAVTNQSVIGVIEPAEIKVRFLDIVPIQSEVLYQRSQILFVCDYVYNE